MAQYVFFSRLFVGYTYARTPGGQDGAEYLRRIAPSFLLEVVAIVVIEYMV